MNRNTGLATTTRGTWLVRMSMLAALGALTGVIAVAVAGAAVTEQVIDACYLTKSGVLRVLSDGTCQKGETTLSWNRQGPQGEQGPQGPVGPQGPAGSSPQLMLARGLLSCTGGCTIFTLRPQGFSSNTEPGNLEHRAFRAPAGGIAASQFAARLSRTVPAGHSMPVFLIETGTSNVFLSCTIGGGQSTCDAGTANATIPAGTEFYVAVNTSYAETGSSLLDVSWRAS